MAEATNVFWERFGEKGGIELLQKVVEAEELGLDLETILDSFIESQEIPCAQENNESI